MDFILDLVDSGYVFLIWIVTLYLYIWMLFDELREARKERAELYNRLMAKDFKEYALFTKENQRKRKKGFIKRAAIQAGLIDYDDSGKS